MRAFNREALEAQGFGGWLRFKDVRKPDIPAEGGVYIIWRESSEPTTFLESSPAGTHKGKDPTVPVNLLQAKWVEGAQVINIGKATSLTTRLNAYRRQGLGMKAGHFGGRYVWQCADSSEFLVAWKVVAADPAQEERRLLNRFRSEYGSLPFANLV